MLFKILKTKKYGQTTMFHQTLGIKADASTFLTNVEGAQLYITAQRLS